MEDNKGIQRVLRKEGDKYFIYFGENLFPKQDDFTDTGEWMAREGFRVAKEQWFLSCEQKGNKVEVSRDGHTSDIVNYVRSITPNGNIEEIIDQVNSDGLLIPLCYEVIPTYTKEKIWIDYAYFKSPDHSEDRSSLKEENEILANNYHVAFEENKGLEQEIERLKEENEKLKEVMQNHINDQDQIISDQEKEIERLRGDLAHYQELNLGHVNGWISDEEIEKEAEKQALNSITWEDGFDTGAKWMRLKLRPSDPPYENHLLNDLTEENKQLKSSLHSSERFRIQDAGSHINEANDLRKKLTDLQEENKQLRGDLALAKPDSERITWLQSIMTPKDNYCEVFFAGLRGNSPATSYQIECNPMVFETLNAETVREAIDKAMNLYSKK